MSIGKQDRKLTLERFGGRVFFKFASILFGGMSAFLLASSVSIAAFSQQPQRQPTPNDTLISPEAHADNRVTFRIYAPKASEVTLRGDWMETPAPVKLEKDDQGVWSATVGALAPDFYSYYFAVAVVTTLCHSKQPITQGG